MKTATQHALDGLPVTGTDNVLALAAMAREAIDSGRVTDDQIERYVMAEETIHYGKATIKGVRRMPVWQKGLRFSAAAMILSVVQKPAE